VGEGFVGERSFAGGGGTPTNRNDVSSLPEKNSRGEPHLGGTVGRGGGGKKNADWKRVPERKKGAT